MSQVGSITIEPVLDEVECIAEALSHFTESKNDFEGQMVSVLMPALNEAECISAVISSIPIDEFAARGFNIEVLVVDNGSTDGTGEVAGNAGARVVTEPKKGYGNAYRRGFAEAKGDIICTLDADGTYPASMLPDIVERLVKGDLDFISTNRFASMHNEAMSPINRLGNSLLNFISRTLFRLPFRDSQSGMWIFRKDLIGRMDLQSSGMSLSQEIKIEAACRLKARCIEVPIYYEKRMGLPKLNRWRDGFGNLFHLMRKRFTWEKPGKSASVSATSQGFGGYQQFQSPYLSYHGTVSVPHSNNVILSPGSQD